jgi:hypothetical protein
MAAEIPEAKSSSTDFPPDRGALWILLAWLTGTVGLAVSMAASIEQRGASRPISVICGAAGATVIVVFAVTCYGAMRRVVWKYARGYPFRIGDRVTITSGPFRGEQGLIVKYWQGEMDFKVTLESDIAGESIWFRVTELRRVNP